MYKGILQLQDPKAPQRQAALHGWLLVLYIAYFALILPFICWGALADPSHPHAAAHFVFAYADDLVLTHVSLTQPLLDLQSAVHTHSHSSGSVHRSAEQTTVGNTSLSSLDQSTPATLLLTLLPLFVATVVAFKPASPCIRLRDFKPLFVLGFLSSNPVPPPRPSLYTV